MNPSSSNSGGGGDGDANGSEKMNPSSSNSGRGGDGDANGSENLRRSKRLKATPSSSSTIHLEMEGERAGTSTDKGGNQEDDEIVELVALQPPAGGERRLVRRMAVGENDVILKEILSYLSIEELKNCRLACQQWWEMSLDRWRRSTRLTLVDNPIHQQLARMGATVAQFKLTSGYKKDPLRLESKPFHHYKLHWISVCSPSISWFWKRMGPSIKTLSITMEHLGDSGGFIKFILSEVPLMEKLSITFPIPSLSPVFYDRLHYRFDRPSPPPERPHRNLKEVEFTFGGSSDNRLEHQWFWAEFFMKCPDVEKLKLSRVGSTWILWGMFKAIPTSYNRENMLGMNLGEDEPHKKILPLKHLDLMDLSILPLSCHHWYEPLLECQFPLECLHLCLGLNNAQEEPTNCTTGRLLESYSNTMKYLDLFRPPLYTPFREFPIHVEMPHLRTLKLMGSITRSFDFLKFMPGLTSLSVISDVSLYDEQSRYQKKFLDILEASSSSGMVTMRVNDSPVLPLQKLYKDPSLVGSLELANLTRLETDFRFNPADFQVMTWWMPRMEALSAIVTNQTFKMICQRWPNLKELSVLWDSSLDDETLTGIQWEQVKACEEVVMTLKPWELSGFDKDGNPVELGIQSPNITCLQQLTYLRVQPRVRDSRINKLDTLKMTDHVILFGILRAPRLRTVVMQDGSATSETIKALKLKIAHISMFTCTSPNEPTSSSMGTQEMQIQLEGEVLDNARVRLVRRGPISGSHIIPIAGEVTGYHLSRGQITGSRKRIAGEVVEYDLPGS